MKGNGTGSQSHVWSSISLSLNECVYEGLMSGWTSSCISPFELERCHFQIPCVQTMLSIYSMRGHIEVKKIWWEFVKVRFKYACLYATILAAYLCGPHVTWFIYIILTHNYILSSRNSSFLSFFLSDFEVKPHYTQRHNMDAISTTFSTNPLTSVNNVTRF